MAIILKNAILCDLSPPSCQRADLRIEGDRIVARGDEHSGAAAHSDDAGRNRAREVPSDVSEPDEVIDCEGAVVLPGLVNGHTHLYSALAVGMPPPSATPQNFREILERVWWRLDRALDAEAIEMSARIAAIDAVRCGVTTLIDHHASPNCISGSLDLIERGIAAAGLRGVLCYETTDRHGCAAGEEGLAENRRFLEKCAACGDGRFAGLVGAHASFTLEDETLRAIAGLAEDFGCGAHIHVAEDLCDEHDCQHRFQTFLIDRLASHGLLRPESVFAHCIHLDDEGIAAVKGSGLTVAHNPRSNMNNGVGYAPVSALGRRVMLGTDGIGSDMFAEARAGWFISRHAAGSEDLHSGIESGARDAAVRHPQLDAVGRPTRRLAPNDLLAMLTAGADRASGALGLPLGKLEVGSAADLIVTDYQPATPISAQNLASHFLFGMSARSVRHVMAGGKWVMRERVVAACDEAALRAASVDVAQGLWERMQHIN